MPGKTTITMNNGNTAQIVTQVRFVAIRGSRSLAKRAAVRATVISETTPL